MVQTATRKRPLARLVWLVLVQRAATLHSLVALRPLPDAYSTLPLLQFATGAEAPSLLVASAGVLQVTSSALSTKRRAGAPVALEPPEQRLPKLKLPELKLPGLPSSMSEDMPAIDWSFLDACFLITCPSSDGANPRLHRAMTQLQAVGLADLTEVRSFATDDDDRIRGCYTSHVTVLEEAAARFADRPPSEPLNVLVLEDNLSISPRITQQTLDSIANFLSGSSRRAAMSRDMVHLAYIMYVPGLSVESNIGGDDEPWNGEIVRLNCNADSVLGTTAYIISRSGLDGVLAEHRRTGYVDAIPNVMARLFPSSRFAAFPMPLHRAAGVKSLVNGQLDSLRSLIFLPQIYTVWERLLVGTGQSTNLLFPLLCVALLLGAIAGGGEATSAIAAAARGEDVSLILPLLSATVSVACLVVIGYGLALAPKPQPQEPQPQERS